MNSAWQTCYLYGKVVITAVAVFFPPKGCFGNASFIALFVYAQKKNETFISVLIKHQGFFVIFQVKENARYLLFFSGASWEVTI